MMQDNESEEAEENTREKNVLDELIVGKGIGNALKVMRTRGVLGVSKIKGRNLD